MNNLFEYLDYYIPNPKCELNYNKDYELLIATVLSAQCTDRRVNEVTKTLFSKYDIFSLSNANIKDIKDIIMPCGSFNKKSEYIIKIAKKLVDDFNGVVPFDEEYLLTLPGVGHKTVSVVFKQIFNAQTIPVDTHVARVSKRLGIANNDDNVSEIENKLKKIIPKDKWSRVSEQLLLFGRYHCKSVNPICEKCLFKNTCQKK